MDKKLLVSECEMFKYITYLGNQVGPGQVHLLEDKVKAVHEFLVPQTKRASRRFLGLCSYHRGF